ncbi:unnamed protein product [Jaminaea pallidilutea]
MAQHGYNGDYGASLSPEQPRQPQHYALQDEGATSSNTSIQRKESNVTRMAAIARLRAAGATRDGASKTEAGTPDRDLLSPPRPQPTLLLQPDSPSDGSSSAHLLHAGRDEADSPEKALLAPSPMGRSGASSPAAQVSLSRSASASRAEARSPLPSLEQLRSRILHERLQAGLQRSASASAASAAARAYAMNKLLGTDASARERATSPVSDSGHGRPGVIDEEEEELEDGAVRRGVPSDEELTQSDDEADRRQSRRSGVNRLQPPGMSTSAPMRTLRRSRTIGSMNQRAENERRAAFQKDIDLIENSPNKDGDRSPRRKRRMSRLPQRKSGASIASVGSVNAVDRPMATYPQPAPSGRTYGLAALERAGESPPSPTDHVESLNEDIPIAMNPTALGRQPSQRDIARSEMMRKLSGRRLGGRSPVPPAASTEAPGTGDTSHETAVNAETDAKEKPGFADLSPEEAPTHDPAQQFVLPAPQLTPEQQMAFLQMQELLRQQQLQLQAATSPVPHGSIEARAHEDYSPSLAEDAYGGTDSEAGKSPGTSSSQQPFRPSSASRSGSADTVSIAPGTPSMSRASREQNGASSLAGTGSDANAQNNLLATPASKGGWKNISTAFGDTPSRSSHYGSPSSSSVGNGMIPSMHFASRTGLSLGDWPSSPTSSSLGFGENEDYHGEEYSLRRRLDNHQGDVRSRTGPPPPSTAVQSSNLLRPTPPRQLFGASTPNSTYSNAFSHDASFSSRISRATSNGAEANQFFYDDLLGGNASIGEQMNSPLPPGSGGQPSSAWPAKASSSGIGSGSASMKSPYKAPHELSNGSGDYAAAQTPTGTVGDSVKPSESTDVNYDDRIGDWRKWMQSQGMDVSDLNSPLEKGEKPELGQVHASRSKAPGMRLELPPVKMVPHSRPELNLDISPSLIREFGADIEWPGQMTHFGGDNNEVATESNHNEQNGQRNIGVLRNHRPAKQVTLSDNHQYGVRGLSGQSVIPSLDDLRRPFETSSQRVSASRPAAPQRLSSIEKPSSERRSDVSPVNSRSDAELASDSPGSHPFSQGLPRDGGPSMSRKNSARVESPSSTRSGAGAAPPSAWSHGNNADVSSAVPKELYRSAHHRVPSASEQATQTAYANNKLNPFPGLFDGQRQDSSARSTPVPGGRDRDGISSISSSTSPVNQHRPRASGSESPSMARTPSANGHANNVRMVSSPMTVEDGNRSASASPSLGLFGSLRRKASALRSASLRRKASNVVAYDVNAAPGTDGMSPSSRAPSQTPPRAGILQRNPSRNASLKRSNSSTSRGAQLQRNIEPKNVAFQDQLVTSGGRAQPRSKTMDGRQLERDADESQDTDGLADTSATTTLSQQHSIVRKPVPLGQHAQHAPAHSRNVSGSSLASTTHGSNGAMHGLSRAPMGGVGDDSLDAGGSASAQMSPVSTAGHLDPNATAMLHRYSKILTSTTKASPASPGVPGLTPADVRSPPRRLLKASPVFQIASASTIKDRFLMLFNDVLIVAKAVAPPQSAQQTGRAENAPDLRWSFVVKNIIELRHLLLATPKDARTRTAKHPLQDIFVDAFPSDPDGALTDIIRRSALPETSQTRAQFLHQTPGLDKRVLTDYLCDSDRRELLTAFIKLRKVTSVSIESALRSVLLDLRFPRDGVAFEALLMEFSAHWVDENRELIKKDFSQQLAADLTFAVMALNDALHGRSDRPNPDDSDDESLYDDDDEPHVPGSGIPGYRPPGIFSEPMKTLSQNAFISAFRVHDPALVLSDRTLTRIYTSIKSEPIQQGYHAREEESEDFEDSRARTIALEGPGLPSKLVYGASTTPLTVTIPEVDPHFSLRLYGQDLQFDPPVLTFEETTSRSFTVTSRTLGVHHAVFVRSGRSARYYSASLTSPTEHPQTRAAAAEGQISDLPQSAAFTVERAFMQNSFALTTTTAVPTSFADGGQSTKPMHRRRFMFSVTDAFQRKEWTDVLQRAITNSIQDRSSHLTKAQKAASALALHVLRQALIEPEGDPGRRRQGSISPTLQRSATVTAASRTTPIGVRNDAGHQRTASDFHAAKQRANPSPLSRNASVSRGYYATEAGQGREGVDLQTQFGAESALEEDVLAGVNRPGEEMYEKDPSTMTGDELVIVARQNSLLPIVLQRSGAT